jgi:hypothetical protein
MLEVCEHKTRLGEELKQFFIPVGSTPPVENEHCITMYQQFRSISEQQMGFRIDWVFFKQFQQLCALGKLRPRPGQEGASLGTD